jgi:hypothetical protein
MVSLSETSWLKCKTRLIAQARFLFYLSYLCFNGTGLAQPPVPKNGSVPIKGVVLPWPPHWYAKYW